MRRNLATLAVGLLCACAPAPPPASPGQSGVWGYLKLVPHEGVSGVVSGSHSYGDRRFEGALLVDYSKPGFAVVFAEGTPSPGGRVALVIRSTAVGPRLEPAEAAVGAGGELTVENKSGAAHIISIPAGGVVRSLAPGESLTLPVSTPGEWPVFLLDVPGKQALVFAAPGRYALVSESGKYAIPDLPPGRATLQAWHPRFPSASALVDLAPGALSRVDIEMGVDRRDDGRAGAK